MYRIDLEGDAILLGLVVSNNRHNEQYPQHHVVQISASKLHEGTAGAVRLGSGDPAFGYVICRDILMVRREELKEDLGELSTETLLAVERALRMVLGL